MGLEPSETMVGLELFRLVMEVQRLYPEGRIPTRFPQYGPNVVLVGKEPTGQNPET